MGIANCNHNKLQKGKVYLVGAGPGRTDLITVRGAETLESADCVICDKLVNPALLDLCRPDAEIIHVPKRAGDISRTQKEINDLLVEKGGSGKIVVRLKGGDPCVFGRCAEEISALAEAQIDFEIVPGITAGIAVAEYAGIMITDRGYSSQVIFVTGREAEDKQKSNIDWHHLAGFGGTIVFYMAMESLDSITAGLIKNGMSPETPAAVIYNVSLPTQKTAAASLQDICEKCRQEKIQPPAIVVIGAAAKANPDLNWFTKKPLFGKTIVATRDSRGNNDFAARIAREGGNPIKFTTIKIKPLTDGNRFLETLGKISDYDWIVLTSSTGVNMLFDSLEKLGKDSRIFGSAKIAAIGRETAAELSRFGIKADFVPDIFTSAQLGEQLIRHANLQNKKVLLLRSELATDELDRLLEREKAQVDNIAVYTALPEKTECRWLLEKINKNEIDWLTFASPSAVTSFFGQIPADSVNASSARVASIGPTTSKELKKQRVKIDTEAIEHTFNGLIAAITEVNI